MDELVKQLIDQKYFNFSFISGDGNEIIDGILLFDLYLFPQYPPDDEIKYFEKVIKLTKQFPCANERLDELENKMGDDKYRHKYRMDYLTLLPRLIAEIDPSVPIIIFSSTEEERDLRKSLLKSYDNIDIFSKPTVFSDIDANKIKDQTDAIEKRKDFRSVLYV